MARCKVVCADIGSVAKGNFAWWSSSRKSGVDLSSLARYVTSLLDAGKPVALGIECPLFIPVVDDESKLTCARPGEGSRAWSAGAGCGALATGLVQLTWILREIKRQIAEPASAYLDWPSFSAASSGLFIWEAFVSGTKKGADHLDDARLAALAFSEALPDPMRANLVPCQSPVLSLAGTALLRTGWSRDRHLLSQTCLVIGPGNPTAEE